MNPAIIVELVQLGLSVFSQVFTLIKSGGVPASAAPQIQNHLNATPGVTSAHTQVINSAVQTAVNVASATN